MWRIVERNIAIMLAGMIFLDLVLFIRVSAAERRYQDVSLNSVLRPATGSGIIPPPNGFLRDGTRLDTSGARTGWAIRYAGADCPYCLKDTQWNFLASKLQNAGVHVIVLLPGPQQAFSKDRLVPEGAPQEAFVTTEWIRHFRLVVTPTLLLFDSHQHLIWHREGMLDPSDVSSALRAVQEIR
jgi:hypothetical protein